MIVITFYIYIYIFSFVISKCDASDALIFVELPYGKYWPNLVLYYVDQTHVNMATHNTNMCFMKFN